MLNKIINFVLIAVLTVIGNIALLFSQSNEVEQFFKKYSDVEGISYVNFSPGPGAMEAAAGANKSDKEVTDIMKNIKSVKILISKKGKSKINLFDEALKSFSSKDWEQYLEVKEDNKKVKMLYKSGEGNKVKEFLLIVSEENEFTVIWISGSIDLKDVSKIQNLMGKGKSPMKKEQRKGN